MSRDDRLDQRAHRIRGAHLVDVGSRGNQRLDGIHVSFSGSEMERGVAADLSNAFCASSALACLSESFAFDSDTFVISMTLPPRCASS